MPGRSLAAGPALLLTALLSGEAFAQVAADPGTAADVIASACLDHLPDFAGTAEALLATDDWQEMAEPGFLRGDFAESQRVLRHVSTGLTVELLRFYGEPACLVTPFSREDAIRLGGEVLDRPPAGDHRPGADFVAGDDQPGAFGVLIRTLAEGVILE
jgi:hypothetical protein